MAARMILEGIYVYDFTLDFFLRKLSFGSWDISKKRVSKENLTFSDNFLKNRKSEKNLKTYIPVTKCTSSHIDG